MLFGFSHYLTWAANFLRNVAGKFDVSSKSSSLGYVGATSVCVCVGDDDRTSWI